MSETAVTNPPAKNKLLRKVLIDLSIMTVIGVVLALIGPFGSFEAPLAARLANWLSLTWVGYAVYSPMGVVVERLHEALDLPAIGLWIAACMIATVPMAAIIWTIRYLPSAPPIPSLEVGLLHYTYVLVIGGGITALMYVLGKRGVGESLTEEQAQTPADTAAPTPTGSEPAETPFFDRLPPALGTYLIALEMEDHYVRAHTALGSDLVLMRMRDAVAELGVLEGAQVHRSWWVAKAAVEGSRKDGRNIRLQLTGGLEAPVSRNMVPRLKESGWL